MDFTPNGILYLAIEQSERGWKLAFTTGFGQKPRYKGIPAGDVERLAEEIKRAGKRFGLTPDATVHSCYEAGREGFWLHRCLEAQGVKSLVVDSSSIDVLDNEELHAMGRALRWKPTGPAKLAKGSK